MTFSWIISVASVLKCSETLKLSTQCHQWLTEVVAESEMSVVQLHVRWQSMPSVFLCLQVWRRMLCVIVVAWGWSGSAI